MENEKRGTDQKRRRRRSGGGRRRGVRKGQIDRKKQEELDGKRGGESCPRRERKI